jgi:phenylalanyl-tRNA synthetase beta chain
MPDAEIEKVLFSLGLKKNDKTWDVPHFRATRDLSNLDDLVEEVGRIIGYENVPEQIPLIQPIAVKQKSLHREQISTMLQGLGFAEVYNYSFINPELSKSLGYPCSDELKLKNPIDSDLSCVRSSLVPSMLAVVNNNLKRFERFALFEFGRAYNAVAKKSNKDSGAVEKQYLCFALTSTNTEKQEIANSVPAIAKGADFYSAVSIVKSLLGKLDLELEALVPPKPWMHPYRNASLSVAGVSFGQVAEVLPGLIDTSSQRVQIVEIDFVALTKLLEASEANTTYRAFSRYPYSFFEISVVMPEKDPFKSLSDIVKSSVEATLLKDLQVLSVYRGKPLAEGQKSISVKLFLGSDHGTLSTEKVSEIQSAVMAAVSNSKYSLRT